MSTISLTRSATRNAAMPPRRRWSEFGSVVCTSVARAWRNFTTRRQLAEMDDRMLKDLGISRAQAQFEADRPLWR